MWNIIKGAWVRHESGQHGTVEKVEKDAVVVQLSTKQKIRIDARQAKGWKVFSSMGEEGHWDNLDQSQ